MLLQAYANQVTRSQSSKLSSFGFSLIEIVVVLAIISVLTSIALPLYDNQFKKARFVEVVTSVQALKKSVEVCFVTKGSFKLENCDSFPKLGVDVSKLTSPEHVKSLQINYDSTLIITGIANPTASKGTDDSFILEGIENNNTIVWSISSSSTCISEGTC